MNDTPIKYFMSVDRPNLVRGTEGASGYDLRSAELESWVIRPGARLLVPTGLYLDMPLGVEAQIRSRSGLAHSQGVCVLNAPGTIDADYRGEVKVNLINLGQNDFIVVPNERIAQIVFAPVFAELTIAEQKFFMAAGAIRNGLVRVNSREDLSETVRGPGGFGSTGRE